MADTDDELQTGELDPERDDDSEADSEAQSESERTAQRVRDTEYEAEVVGLTPVEAAIRHAKEERERLRDQDELDAAHAERIERAQRKEREEEAIRDRHELTAAEDTALAIKAAVVLEESRDRNRRDAGTERVQGRRERSRGNDLISQADSRRDEPGAEATATATAAAGRVHLRRADDADRRARNYELDAAGDDEAARSRRSEAAEAQKDAPATGAVDNPPKEPPVARPNVKRQKNKKKKAERDTSGQPDLTLGPR